MALGHTTAMLRPAVLVLTFVTGFTGLAYEVTWQKYLAILLGAHSEATAAVLGLFLGGLSLGYWIFGALTRRMVERSERSGRPPPLLVVYGAVEAAIGLLCVFFPWTFSGVRTVSVLLPTGVGALGFGVDVALAALLVLPPAVLMGGTIPILTQALARSLEDATRLHAFVYAFNTAGAFAGALASGFVLVHWLGLEGVMRAMGAVNLVVGALLALLGAQRREIVRLEVGGEEAAPPSAAPAVYGVVAMLVGFAMMAFQTSIIRIGGLSFGSSEYTFSMVVAVFVLCIALGSAGVSLLPRIGRWLLPATLWALAALFAGLYALLETGPYWAHLLRTIFRDDVAGFGPFWALAFAGVLVAIGPAVILSGATLPLLFHSLKREVGDLGARAGRLYSLNTVGSLGGALLGGYALLFVLDLHHVYRIGVALLVLAAALATLMHYPGLRFAGVAVVLLAALVGVASLPAWRASWLAAGMFRERQARAWTHGGPWAVPHHQLQFSFYDDDPNSSVAVQETGPAEQASRSIIVNGKSDGNTLGDYATMAMAALVPALLAERVEHAFVIGYGTGVTAGELAALDEVESVTVAEISPAVVDAAPFFDFANLEASKSPKVEIVRSDAYRALLKGRREYDVIVSEPSNPWVTGSEMLFSQEFLSEARDRLSPRGVYCQWFHLYETNDEAVELVLRTYASVFDRVAIWSVNGVDLLLLGFRDASLALDLDRLMERMFQPDFVEALNRLNFDGPAALLAHEAVPLGVVNAARLEGPVHSLYRPRLSHVAGRGFFVGRQGKLPFLGYGEPARIGLENSLLRRRLERFPGPVPQSVQARIVRHSCGTLLASCEALLAEWLRDRPQQPLPAWVREIPRSQQRLATARRLRPLLEPSADGSDGPLRPAAALERTRLFLEHSTALAPFVPAALVGVWQRCGGPGAEGPCRRGLELAQRLARGEPVPPVEGWLARAESNGAPEAATSRSPRVAQTEPRHAADEPEAEDPPEAEASPRAPALPPPAAGRSDG